MKSRISFIKMTFKDCRWRCQPIFHHMLTITWWKIRRTLTMLAWFSVT